MYKQLFYLGRDYFLYVLQFSCSYWCFIYIESLVLITQCPVVVHTRYETSRLYSVHTTIGHHVINMTTSSIQNSRYMKHKRENCSEKDGVMSYGILIQKQNWEISILSSIIVFSNHNTICLQHSVFNFWNYCCHCQASSYVVQLTFWILWLWSTLLLSVTISLNLCCYKVSASCIKYLP
jgi:hypothetical protein